jgi:hypothetical protein
MGRNSIITIEDINNITDNERLEKVKLPVDYTKLTLQQKREVRLEYIELQKGKCYWCGSDLNKEVPKRITKLYINWALFPKNFLQYPIHLQHCHKTGMTEGAVHAYCNAVMWQYENR